MTDQEQKEWDLNLRKIDAEIANLNAQTPNLVTELYLLVLGAAFFAAAAAFTKFFL